MAPRRKAKTFLEITQSGDQKATLEATRDRVAMALEMAEPREVATLAKQLAALVKEIEELPDAEEVSAVDQLAKKRAARRASNPKARTSSA